MNLLDELTANAYRIERASRGTRVSFAIDGEEAEERRLEKEAAVRPSYARAETYRVPARELVLAVLREGRARFESDITSATGLSHPTVIANLRQLRMQGEVEFHHVGNFRLWSRCRPTPDDPSCLCSLNHSVR